MRKHKSKLSIFTYTDYRKYLSDFYLEQKKVNNAFSYRFFSRKAGINSVGLYRDVVEGRQKLGRALIMKFSTAIGHSRKEAEYFENMVFFNEAKTNEERKLFFERMISSQGLKGKIIETTRYEYYQKWYYSAVRALVSIGRFKYDEKSFRKIAGILNPRIRPDKAKKSLDILKRLEFITEDSNGFFILTDTVITTGVLKPEKNVNILNIVNYQKEVMDLANGAVDIFKPENINLSTLTLAVSDKTKTIIKEELAAVRSKIALLAENDNKPNRVFQLNMQFFPLSDVCKGDGGA
ncbi:MAG: TIGR02147 family protein [Fibrobacter sp.]|nr:TIGR02147 family protein [Fibrobacter sp.]